MFPDPLNKPLLSWLLGAVSCGSSLSGLSDPLSCTALAQLSEAAHVTSHILSSVSRSLRVCFSRAHTGTLQLLCDPSSWPQLSPLLCAPFSVPHPLLNPVQSSLPQTHCDTLSCPHAPASKAAILPASPSVTFHVPFRLFHTLLTRLWGTLPDSPPSSLHHSTAAFRLLLQSHPSQLKPPSALSLGPAVCPPPLTPSQQSPLPKSLLH